MVYKQTSREILLHKIKITSPKYIDICDYYGLSKCFSSVDTFYDVEIPEIWFFDYSKGRVMGRAEYQHFFTFFQGCTVGNNKGLYPRVCEYQ